MLVVFVTGISTVALGQEPQGPAHYDSESSDGRCYFNGTLSEAQRRKIFPFNKAVKVAVIAFNCTEGKAPLASDTIESARVIEKVLLNDEQIDGLTDILYNYNVAEGTSYFSVMDACTNPEHALVFMDKADKVIATIEFCFHKDARRTSLPPKSIGTFCHGKYDLVKSLIQKAGITYFTIGDGCK